MSEQELRDSLKLAVADEPPMAVDLDELVVTAERLVRRRRALVAVGVSTAAVAVVAVMVPVVLGVGGAPQELPTAASPSAPVTPAPKPQNLTVAQLKQRGEELAAHLKTQLPLVVPNAKDITAGPFGGEAEGQFWDGQKYLEGNVRFKLGAVQTTVAVQVNVDPQVEPCPGCQELPQPDGSKVVIHATTGSTEMMQITSAIHYRNDGSAARVTTYNYDMAAGATDFQQSVALSNEQLVRLATDPALHL